MDPPITLRDQAKQTNDDRLLIGLDSIRIVFVLYIMFDTGN